MFYGYDINHILSSIIMETCSSPTVSDDIAFLLAAMSLHTAANSKDNNHVFLTVDGDKIRKYDTTITLRSDTDKIAPSVKRRRCVKM